MGDFLTGIIAMAFWVAGLFFLRFWRDSKDRLFLIFAIAFWILALTRVGLVLSGPGRHDENNTIFALYVLRLVAYLLIIVAIVDKNWLASRQKSTS
jgi:hypothetical protein